MPFKPTTQSAKKEQPKKGSAAKAVEEKKLASQKETLEEEIRYRKGTATIKDLIAPAAFEIQPTLVRVGSQFARTIFVTAYPRYINVGWFAPIINFSSSFDVAFFFVPLPSNMVLKKLRDKVGRVQAEIGMREEKGKPRDPSLEIGLRDMERLRDELTQGTEHFFSIGLYITIYANSAKDIDKLTEDIEALFSSRLVYTKRVLYQSEQGFNSTLPLCDDELMVFFNMNTSPAATAFPFVSADLTTDNGILYGINRHNNSLILFDRFSLQNANQVVFATSGAGKSVEYSTEVLIRDAQGERLVRIGEYIDSLESARTLECIDDEMEGVMFPGIEVYSYNNELKGEWSEVSVAARKKSPEDEYVFHTQSGREITVTGDHNMLVLRNGKVITAKSEEIQEGEYIPLPTAIYDGIDTHESTYWNVLTLLENDARMHVRSSLSTRRLPIKEFIFRLDACGAQEREHVLQSSMLCSRNGSGWTLPCRFSPPPSLFRLMGYIISEGTITTRTILISQKDSEIISDIAQCFHELSCPYFQRKDGTFVIASIVFVALMHVLGVAGTSSTKRAPGIIMGLHKSLAAEFLRGYFEGDGGCEQHAVSATSKSAELISDLSYLLLRFGIVARLSKRKKRATNSKAEGIYSILTISGQDFLKQFYDHIGFVSRRKSQSLKMLLGKKDNTNVWTIPVKDVFRELYSLFECALRGNQDVIELKNGSYQPSREKLKKVISAIECSVERFIRLQHHIDVLSHLPHTTSIVTMGRCDKEINRALWSELGQTWRLMKHYSVSPFASTFFRAYSAISDNEYDVGEIQNAVHYGFRELNLSMNQYGNLRDGLKESGDMRYSKLHAAAQTVTSYYNHISRRLPRIEECIDKLKRLADADLVWDPIVNIKKKQSLHPYVYDLTVDNEVFLAGNGGLFVHNSYAVKLEVLRTMMMGTDVIIIDPEREYQHLCDATGGTYINVSLSSQSKLNPFDLPRAVGEQTSTTDILRSAVITLKGLMRLMLGKITEEEDSMLDRALLETYAKKDITADTDLSKVAEVPTLTDLLEVLEGMEGTHSLVQRLMKYTDGTFAGLLNNPTNVELSNQLVVFSVRDLEDELRPVAIYTIVNYIWNVVRSELKRRILVIDEAWWLMQYEDSAKFIFALVKRCRKYYLGVTTITQDVNDFLTSPYGKAILTNSAIQILLKQSPAAIDLIQRTFMLTEGEKYLLLESAPGEGIFFAGQKHVAMKVVASYSEDQLITTDPRQLLEIDAAKKEFSEEKK